TNGLTDCVAANDRAENCAEKRGSHRRCVALRGVPRGNMTDFVADYACQFRLVIDESHQTASDIDIPPRQRKCIDDGTIENRHPVRVTWLIRCLDAASRYPGTIGAELSVIIGATIGL